MKREVKNWLLVGTAGLVVVGVAFVGLMGAGGETPSRVRAESDSLDPSAIGYWLALRSSPERPIDYGRYLDEWRRLQGPKPARFMAQPQAGPWTFAGPKNLDIPSRNFYGTKPIVGRVNAVAVEPGATPKVYLGGPFGGVWRGSNTTAWTPISDQLFPLIMIGALANKDGKVYAGSGDAHLAYLGAQGKTLGTSAVWIYDKTSSTWEQTGNDELGTLTNRGETIRHGAHINSIVPIHEVKDSMLVAACHGDALASGKNPNGLWKYDGKTKKWSRAVADEENFFDLAFGALSQATGRRYYYAVSLDSTDLRRSGDDGKTWVKLATPARVSNPKAIQVAASPIEPNTVYLMSYVSKKIWRSKNAGQTLGGWEDITGDIDGLVWSQEDYNWLLEVGSVKGDDGKDKDVVVAGGVRVCVLSDPVAKKWTEFSGDQTADSVIHRDFQSIAFSPDRKNEAYIGTDGGVYRVTFDKDFKATVENYMTREADPQFGITQFYYIAASGNDHGSILGGAQDNCTPFATGASMGANKNWTNPCSLGDGGASDVSPVDGKRWIQGGYVDRRSMSFFYTEDDWKEAPRLNKDCPVPGDERARLFFPPVIMDAQSSDYAFTAFQRLHIFSFVTADWKKAQKAGNVDGVELGNDYVVCLAHAPGNADYIYSGSNDGQVWLSLFENLSIILKDQTRVDTGTPGINNPAGDPITSISVDPADPKRIVVGIGGDDRDKVGARIWVCDDVTKAVGARKWEDKTGTGLPKIPVNSVRFWHSDPKEWWVTNDLGVFYTQDNGVTYKSANKNLPSTVVNDLKIVAGSPMITVGTFGRGAWQARRADLIAPGP
ncbi:MAG: hypothetical protein KF884_03060 [Fimbriimonadaceae bacterium]|nr:hypothetical protein [Fimbriimonadaceae bacterium]QYK59076.1 MAG: hypothetical protein KF884_03060 [Fimbriimonadaceae bacterium]